MKRYSTNNRNTLSQLVFISVILICALFFFSCGSKKTDEAADTRPAYFIPDSLMKTMAIDTVQYSALTASIKFNGVVDVNPDKVVNVFPLVSGNVQGLSPAQVGDFVHKGQVLGIVKSAEVTAYDASLANAEAAVRLNAAQLARTKEMAKGGLASQVDVTSAEVAYQQSLASLAQAKNVLSINGNSRKGDYTIKAPIDGYIMQKNVTAGMSIRPDNNNPLYTISDLGTVWVQANVYEANIGKVHEGDAADVTTISYPDKVFHGKVDKLLNVLDPANRVMKMRIVLPNEGYALKPQMFATVTVNNKTNGQQALAVPANALVFDNSQYYVLIYQSPSDVQIRKVNVITTNGTQAFIQDGVAQGEKVIGSNALLIYGELNS